MPLEGPAPSPAHPTEKTNAHLFSHQSTLLFLSQKKQGQRAPLTEYYMWPRKDAWEELKAALEAKPWVPARDRVALLNRTTEVINFWQDDAAKHEVDEAREKFPDCQFSS